MVESDRLEKGLTEIQPDDASIDMFSDFPNTHAVKHQLWCRQLGVIGLQYYTEKADFSAEIMRAHQRKGRTELKEALIHKLNEEEESMLGIAGDEIRKGKE